MNTTLKVATREFVIVENICQEILESVISWGHYVQTSVNQFFLTLSQLIFDAKPNILFETQKSAVKSNRQAWRIFSTITNSLVAIDAHKKKK